MTTASDRHAVVIGAGLGGISAAVSLAAAGWRVEMYEKNQHVGGKLNRLTRDGYSFDLGPSILTLPAVFEALFRSSGEKLQDHVELVSLEPHWRNFFEDGTCLDLYASAELTCERNKGLTSTDREDLHRFLRYSQSLYDACRPSYFEKGLDTLWSMVRYHGVISTLRDFDVFSTVDDGVRRHVRNRYLRDILNFFVKYVGSSPYDAPAVLNLLAHVQSAYGLWYVKGGLGELGRALRGLVERAGVELHVGTAVTGLLHDHARATGVRLQDGSERHAPVVVSNMEVIPFYRRLTSGSEATVRKLRRFAPACSGLVLHLGVDREYPQLAHHNFFFSADPREHYASVFHRGELPEDPTLYVVATARTDPTQAPPGCESLKILPHIPPVQDPPFTREAYGALRDRVLDKLERMGLRELRQHIRVEHMWVPEDIERLYYCNRGAIYGVVADRRRNLGLKCPKKSTRFAGLWFVGGSVNPGAGMPMVLLSGRMVADRILSQQS